MATVETDNQNGSGPSGAEISRNTDSDSAGAGRGSARAETDAGADSRKPDNLEFILDIPLEVSVELGRTKMLVNELLKLGQGSVIELTKLAGETLEILANQKPIARGEVVVVNDKYGIRLTEVISPMERLERLG